ncbi:MAG: alpha/beta hydrolase [Anaerolineae bacterium]
MRRLLSPSLGLFSAATGLLLISRDEDNVLRPLQIVINELSWVSAAVGVVAIIAGTITRPRSWLGVLSGIFGTAVSLKPFVVHRAVAEDMASAMRAGLGRDYETQIPPIIRRRLQPSVWSWRHAFGERHREVHAHITTDIPYACPDGKSLKLDVYQPVEPPAVGTSYPAVIVVHGGGWRNGDKSDYFVWNNRYLASLGYVVFDIQYRLSPQSQWPAQLRDIHAAVRWVKSHAEAYQIDKTRIALLGRSAGAHLALMAAFRAEEAEQVQAVISFYGPANMKWESLASDSPIVELIGGRWEDLPAEYTDANPLDWVRDDLPPLLVIEGGMDTLVPNIHGDMLRERFASTNSCYVLLRLPWARHGFDAVPYGIGSQLVQYHVDRFLAHAFYGRPQSA